jgi:hypothetical protein
MQGAWTVPFAMYGFIPFVAIAFMVLRPPRAVLLCYLVGWMFLPVVSFDIPGFIDYGKNTAVALVVFLAIVVFDGGRLARFRLRVVDLPVLAYCATPLASSLSNGLGWYNGLSGAIFESIKWGLPYLAGRLYCSTPEGLRQLALALMAATVAYAPLCLWEIRMSPQLHATLYGFQQHSWAQVLRGSGYRPMVFMHHGLMVGLWMAAGSLVAVAVSASGVLRRFLGVPPALVAAGLVVMTVLCNSFGAAVLLVVGMLALFSMRSLRTSLPLLLLLCLPPAYIASRVSGNWSGVELSRLVAGISPERAGSLAFRMQSEEYLIDTAAQRPVFGWGGWGRSMVRQTDTPGVEETVGVDSLWIIVLGKQGVVGVTLMLLVFLVPVLTLWRRIPPRSWPDPGAVFAWALALVFTMYAIDNLVNAMLNPVYMLIAGGLCGLAPLPLRRARADVPEPGRLRPLRSPAGGPRMP